MPRICAEMRGAKGLKVHAKRMISRQVETDDEREDINLAVHATPQASEEGRQVHSRIPCACVCVYARPCEGVDVLMCR